MKKGANFQDRNAIQRLEAKGHDAEEISRAVNVVPEVVRNFMKDPDGRTEGLPDGVFLSEDGSHLVNEDGAAVEIDEDGEVQIVEE